MDNHNTNAMEVERTYINRMEYDALLEIFGVLSSLMEKKESLQSRAESADHADKDLKEAEKYLTIALQKIMRTIPVDRINRLSKEMDSIVVSVEQKGRGYHYLPGSAKERYGFFPWTPIVTLVNYIIENECYLCDKSGKDIRDCPIKKAIEAIYPYEVTGNYKKICPYNGLSFLDDSNQQ